MTCKHCGTDKDLIAGRDGQPTRICGECRRAQRRRTRAQRKADEDAFRARAREQIERNRPRLPEKKKMTIAERTEAIARAHAAAQSTNLPLVDALKREGVL